MSSSSANSRELDSAPPDDINTELALWKQLVFDMAPPQDKPHDAHDDPRPQTPVMAPLHLPPETYTYLIHALLSLQGSTYPHSHPPTSPYPAVPNYNYPWPLVAAPPISAASIAGSSPFYPTNPPMPPPRLGPPSISSSQLTTPAASTAQDPEAMENAMSITEDKRRRNTAASARFRIKKKLKTLNLEHTVGDLTRRTEELEREANDLRRENGWLKEIVLLKGRNLATSNLGSQAPAPSNRHDGDEKGSEVESTVKRGGTGKDKDN